MKLRDHIATWGPLVIATFCLFVIIKPDPSVPSDPGKERIDSLNLDKLFKARLSAEKVKWADSVGRFADDIEARTLPPETLYRYHHEESLTADTSAMYRYMGQMPRDTAITH